MLNTVCMTRRLLVDQSQRNDAVKDTGCGDTASCTQFPTLARQFLGPCCLWSPNQHLSHTIDARPHATHLISRPPHQRSAGHTPGRVASALRLASTRSQRHGRPTIGALLSCSLQVLLSAAEFINDEFAALSLDEAAAEGQPPPAAEEDPQDTHTRTAAHTQVHAQAAPLAPLEALVARARALLCQLERCASRTPGRGRGVTDAVPLDTPAAPAAEEAAWSRLSRLTWCPVLQTAPHPGG